MIRKQKQHLWVFQNDMLSNFCSYIWSLMIKNKAFYSCCYVFQLVVPTIPVELKRRIGAHRYLLVDDQTCQACRVDFNLKLYTTWNVMVRSRLDTYLNTFLPLIIWCGKKERDQYNLLWRWLLILISVCKFITIQISCLIKFVIDDIMLLITIEFFCNGNMFSQTNWT